MFESSAMYPTGFHPVKLNRNRDFKGEATAYTRTQRPPRYLFIDFGLSRRYTTRDEPLHHDGGDRSAPGLKSQKWSNPFHTDVYYIGNLVRNEFMRVRSRISRTVVSISFLSQKYRGFRFMEELIDAMTDKDITRRPSIEEVIERFTVVRGSLRGTKLRSALTSKKVPRIFSVIRQARQYLLTTQYIILRQAAIPDL